MDPRPYWQKISAHPPAQLDAALHAAAGKKDGEYFGLTGVPHDDYREALAGHADQNFSFLKFFHFLL